ncbi:ethyl tert-butyl ether degradation protein EthD [Caballeronia sp. LZ034LL]|uniref:ethyl tert-butyl ether degradation protein EthD n=1 Tax=Caballeronia sp. LZ034LL TaxID=3038567 RepID=UPI00286749A2|nr:ethyl tert-butyl ether degradation protein EthD [Caballeronia sp. LZ034LL]MDR5836172.1 ethyl tert-butyl ether degradation protein EthD [Caballeronia sp. LZ034LL]
MRFTLYLEGAIRKAQAGESRPTVADAVAMHAWLASRHAAFDGLTKAIVHTPVADGVSDPYHGREASPDCVVQLYFSELDGLERSCRAKGPVAELLSAMASRTRADYDWTQQTMAARSFAVPETNVLLAAPAAGPHCTYLVAYPGPADDLHLWLRHYIDHHPPIMAKFPGIREAEIFTRVDSPNTLDVRRADLMQRNKVVFDDPAALHRALASEIRHEMREDGLRFPPFAGGSSHYPMASVARRYG